MQIIKRAITIAVVTAVFFFLIRSLALNWSKIPFADIHFNIPMLVLSFVALAAYFAVYSRSWQVIMRDLDEPISFLQALSMIATTQVGKYLPGKVWYIVGRVYMGKQASLDGKKLTLSMVLETSLVYFTGCLLFSLTSIITGNHNVTLSVISILLAAAAVIVIHPRILGRISNFTLRILKKPEIHLKLTYRQISRISLYFFGIWIAQIAGFFLLINALYPIPVDTVFNLASAYIIAWITGSVALFAPGGLGVREGIMTLLLSQTMPLPLAIAMSFIARIWVTIFEATMFFVGLAIQNKLRVGRSS